MNGTMSVVVKRGRREGAETDALQDPHDMAKAGLLEVQSQEGICEVPIATAPNSDADPYAGIMGRSHNLAEGESVTSVGLTADNESE
jgi:hypothetical protein